MKRLKHYYKTITKVLTLYFIFVVGPLALAILITSRSSFLFGIKSYTVLTGSMEPVIHVGSIVFVQPSASYNVGDVITFNRGNITVTHRIHAVANNQFQTKGDANKEVDPQLVQRSAIIGKEFVIIPSIGRYIAFIKTVPGFILFIVVPTAIYIVLELISIRKELEKEIEKKLLARLEQIKNV